MFKEIIYGCKVKVVSGFYKGQQGIAIEEEQGNACNSIHYKIAINTCRENILKEITPTISVNDLKLIV